MVALGRRLGIVMDFVDGGNLRELYRTVRSKGDTLSGTCLKSILLQALQALEVQLCHVNNRVSNRHVETNKLSCCIRYGMFQQIQKELSCCIKP